MPSLDYIEKLTGIKGMDSKFKGNGISLGFSGSAAASRTHLPSLQGVKATTRRIKGYYTRLIKHFPLLHKELHLLYRQRRYICSCGHTVNEKSPFASVFPNLFLASTSHAQELRQHLLSKKWPDDAMSAPARSFVSLMKSIFLVPVTFPACFPSMNLKEMLPVRSTKSSSLTLKNKRIMDILPVRTTPALLQYFYQFPMSERRKVEFVTMDMSMQFRSVIKTIFPKARIVADRFHMIRLVQWAMERVRKAEQKRLYHHSRMFKSNKTILTKPYEKLTEEELIKLEGILRCSPRLRCAYALKYAFSKVLRFKDNANISWALSAWIDLVKSADLPEMNSLVKSFTYWYEEIRSALIYPYSNGFTEGCNNKIKVLKRVSFGLRNFERFRNRILYINTRNEKRTRTVFSACPLQECIDTLAPQKI